MIREATYDDIERLTRLARTFHNGTDFAYLPFSAEDCRKHMRMAIDDRDFFFMCSDDSVMIAVMSSTFHCAGKVAKELMWFSKGRDGIKLLFAYEKWAKEKKADVALISPIVNEYIRENKVAGFLERRGWIKVETSYMRKL